MSQALDLEIKKLAQLVEDFSAAFVPERIPLFQYKSVFNCLTIISSKFLLISLSLFDAISYSDTHIMRLRLLIAIKRARRAVAWSAIATTVLYGHSSDCHQDGEFISRSFLNISMSIYA